VRLPPGWLETGQLCAPQHLLLLLPVLHLLLLLPLLYLLLLVQ
jgi:hypothetical protein